MCSSNIIIKLNKGLVTVGWCSVFDGDLKSTMLIVRLISEVRLMLKESLYKPRDYCVIKYG